MYQPSIRIQESVAPGVDQVGTALPLPGLGFLQVNAYLLRAAEPMLIDTGVCALGEPTFDAITQLIEPEDVRWIYLTHTDADHIGALERLLETAPNARIVTTFLGMGKLGLRSAIPPERVYLLNPGQSLELGDRQVQVTSPPIFDAPETTCLLDPKSRALFSSDCFGAVLSDPNVGSAAELSEQQLAAGMSAWANIDAPWLSKLPRDAFGRDIARFVDGPIDTVLSSHLPPAPAMSSKLGNHLLNASGREPFVGPDQAALEQMFAA